MTTFEYGLEEINYLKKDKYLKKYIEEIGFIKRKVFKSPFESIINTIISQQISNKAFESIWQKFKNQFPIVNPVVIINTNEEIIRKCGISYRKIGYIKKIAKMIIDGEISLDKIQKTEDNEAIDMLVSLPGIGRWSAQMILIFGYQRKNIISFMDLVIIRAMKHIYKKKEITKEFFELISKKYSPYSTIASFYLWEVGNNLK